MSLITSPPARAIDIAKLCVCKAYERDKEFTDITTTKLLKLLYFAQAISLVISDQPLFKEEIEAGEHGPSIDSVYKRYKTHGYKIIPKDKNCDHPQFSEDILQVVKSTLELFDKYSAKELVDITHRHDPWKNVYKKDNNHILISNKSIQEYYKDVFSVA